jgi:NmrA-like family
MLSKPMDTILASDAGEITHQVFLHPDKYIGQWLPLSSDCLTIDEYANIMSKAFGKKFVAGTVSIVHTFGF